MQVVDRLQQHVCAKSTENLVKHKPNPKKNEWELKKGRRKDYDRTQVLKLARLQLGILVL